MIDAEHVARCAGVIARYDHAPPSATPADGAEISLWHTEAAAPGVVWHVAVFGDRTDRDRYLLHHVDTDGVKVWRTDVVAGKWSSPANRATHAGAD